MIRRVEPKDAARLAEIYNYYIAHSTATFETESLTAVQMWARAEAILQEGYPYWVYELDGRVEGYAYLGRWKERCAYETTAEVSLYVASDTRGRGVGRQLLTHLLSTLDRARFHALVACIALPNEPSVALHERLGFVQVSQMNQVGRKFGAWCDIGHWILYPEQVADQEESCACGAHAVCRCD